MVEHWGSRARGIGDDAAIVTMPRGDALIASVDSSVEGRHFRRGWLSPREIGYRAVVAALSDLAAMAARPIGVLVALAVPVSWRNDLTAIADGIGNAVDRARTVILGGNLTDAAELSITTTVLGSAFAPLTRAGARVGDHVYVTGRLGGPGSVLAALTAGKDPSSTARQSFAQPSARIAEAIWLADRGATAAIDISDGLAGDLAHLAAASAVSIEVDVDRIPVVNGVAREDALRSGEEYELVVTSPNVIDAADFEKRFTIPLADIGRVVSRDEKPSVMLLANGTRVANPLGHDHFS
jgi:thiamine-monophosphate kinase